MLDIYCKFRPERRDGLGCWELREICLNVWNVRDSDNIHLDPLVRVTVTTQKGGILLAGKVLSKGKKRFYPKVDCLDEAVVVNAESIVLEGWWETHREPPRYNGVSWVNLFGSCGNSDLIGRRQSYYLILTDYVLVTDDGFRTNDMVCDDVLLEREPNDAKNARFAMRTAYQHFCGHNLPKALWLQRVLPCLRLFTIPEYRLPQYTIAPWWKWCDEVNDEELLRQFAIAIGADVEEGIKERQKIKLELAREAAEKGIEEIENEKIIHGERPDASPRTDHDDDLASESTR